MLKTEFVIANWGCERYMNKIVVSSDSGVLEEFSNKAVSSGVNVLFDRNDWFLFNQHLDFNNYKHLKIGFMTA